MLIIDDLHVTVEGKKVVRGISLKLKPGKIHALMGPNGSGKTSLSLALAGHPSYSIAQGVVKLDGADITSQTPNEKAQAGLFLAPQYPVGIEGVTVEQLLRRVVTVTPRTVTRRGSSEVAAIDVLEFRKKLKKMAIKLGLNPEILHRSLNVSTSGGEKKRLEILQMLALQPRYAILDETDSGLDVDALKTAARAIRSFVLRPSSFGLHPPGVLVITHYARLLRHLKPDRVHIMQAGHITRSGSSQLSEEIENKGYKSE